MSNIFKKAIYTLIKKIPKSKVTTYGIIAKILKLKSPRIVGKILHQNKNPNKYPCHRVVFSDGKLSKSYAFGGLKAQKEKLVKEGITFLKNRVNLKKHLFLFTDVSRPSNKQ